MEHGRYSYKSLRIFFLIFLLFPIARAASLQHFGKSETYFVILLERLEVQAPNVYIGQEFWVRAIFVAGYMPYDANNFTATIELPEGFKSRTDSRQILLEFVKHDRSPETEYASIPEVPA